MAYLPHQMGGIITVKRTKEENGWDILACDVGLADLTKTTIFFPEREKSKNCWLS